MKKLNLRLLPLIGLIILSCSKDNDSNCVISEVIEPFNFGVTQEEMINQFSINVEPTMQNYFYRFDLDYEIPEEISRTYFTRNIPNSADENLQRYYYACYITYSPNDNNYECIKSWLEEKYGEPDFISENNPNDNYFYFKWYFDEPDTDGNYKNFISLFRESNEQETETEYLRLDYNDETLLN